MEDQSADEVLVKPMNTQDLLVQIEALLVTHEDKKRVRSAHDLAFAGVSTGSGKRSTSKVASGRSK
jgi:DNA-binding response OmpR family regulator